MNNKILCVDDDANILQGYRRILRRDFDIHIAGGGKEAVAALSREQNFAVIVSDMRMPGMNGVEFLSRAKEIAPDSVRIMLTGDAGQQTAMDAVNEGTIFRFLTKPCSPEMLAKALKAGLEQFRLITAEKELLEQTLGNSIQVLIDVLAMVNSTAFSRATRVKRLTHEIAVRLGIQNIWEVELAALLSQIGCISVPETILRKISDCQQLTESELVLFQNHPKIGHDLIAQIPRLETVAAIIANQNLRRNDYELPEYELLGPITKICSQILKVVLDFDRLNELGNSPEDAVELMEDRDGWYDPLTLIILREINDDLVKQYLLRQISVINLEIGMIMGQDICSLDGTKIIEQGQEINLPLIMRLKNFAENGLIDDLIRVKIPFKHEAKRPFLPLSKSDIETYTGQLTVA